MSEDIHSLLGRYFSGEATEAERRQVEIWIAGSEAAREEYHLLEKLWKGPADTTPVVFDTARAWTRVDAALQGKTAPVRPLFPRWAAIGVAASVLLAFVFWWLTENRWKTTTEVAQIGVKEVALPDGSTVHLRQGSRLTYHNSYGKKHRAVALTGEAFFEVQKDAAKQFIVEAGEAEVTVLGTSFLVAEKKNSVRVVVQTGRVQLRPAEDTATGTVLVAGETGQLSGRKLSKGANTDENFNAWQTGTLVFNDTPLPQVAAALSDFYGVSIRLHSADTAALSAVRITISFKDEPLESVLNQLSLITTYSIRPVGMDAYEISQN